MKLLNFTIIKITLCLIIGLIIGFNFSFPLSYILFALGLCTSALIVGYIYSDRSFRSSYLFTGISFLSFIFIGIFSTLISDETLQDSHYTNSNINFEKTQNLSFKINKRLKPDAYNSKYIVELRSLNNKKASGQLLLNLQKDSIVTELSIGTTHYTANPLVAVQKPKNPFQFDYSNYLKQRQIHHQVYVEQDELLQVAAGSASLFHYADTFRKTVNEKLEKAGFESEALGIINALLLGQRQDIDQEIYNNYVSAGTIHILAVSGLHVGIIYLILSSVFRPLHRLKHGRHFIKPILIILLLWAFAIVAGLSPSVTRAVTMFSIIAIAQNLKRPTNIYNTITISAFVILLYKPIFLFDIGFQMSYLAVLAIVSIQPLLYKLWQPKYYALDKPWQIFTVTIAAQLGVAPISLFYFHQFPGLFFVSNLVIIPFLGLILGFGVLVIALALLNVLPDILVVSFSFVIDSLNGFIAWVAQFENFLFRDIPFNAYQVITAYLIIITMTQLLKHRKIENVKYALVSFMLFYGVLFYTKFETSGNEFIIFNKNNNSMIAEKKNKTLFISSDKGSLNFNQDKTLKNYAVGNFIKTIEPGSLQSVYNYKDKLILVVDSLSVYNVSRFKPNYILLRNSPKLNLNRLIDSLKPEQIIADASNYKSFVDLWKLTCIDKKIPFHSTYDKGAFIIKL